MFTINFVLAIICLLVSNWLLENKLRLLRRLAGYRKYSLVCSKTKDYILNEILTQSKLTCYEA